MEIFLLFSPCAPSCTTLLPPTTKYNRPYTTSKTIILSLSLFLCPIRNLRTCQCLRTAFLPCLHPDPTKYQVDMVHCCNMQTIHAWLPPDILYLPATQSHLSPSTTSRPVHLFDSEKVGPNDYSKQSSLRTERCQLSNFQENCITDRLSMELVTYLWCRLRSMY